MGMSFDKSLNRRAWLRGLTAMPKYRCARVIQGLLLVWRPCFRPHYLSLISMEHAVLMRGEYLLYRADERKIDILIFDVQCPMGSFR